MIYGSEDGRYDVSEAATKRSEGREPTADSMPANWSRTSETTLDGGSLHSVGVRGTVFAVP